MPYTPKQLAAMHFACKRGQESACKALRKWKREKGKK